MNNFKTMTVQMSWGNIQDSIIPFLEATQKGRFKSGDEIMSLKINNYQGGYLDPEKLMDVEFVIQKGVKLITFG